MKMKPEEVEYYVIEALAKDIQLNKTGMVRTRKLLEGISMSAVEKKGETISVDLISSAPYSKNLEWGMLFGEGRPGKERRFFTGHLHSLTLPTMRQKLLENLRDEFK